MVCLFRFTGIALLFLFTACVVKELPYNGDDHLIPVCNAFVSPDQAFSIHLSYSANITGHITTMDEANIDVYENGKLQNIVFLEENGLYSSDFFPKAGNVYCIDVWKNGVKLLSACDTVPDKVSIEDPCWQFPVGMLDEWTQAGLVTFTFKDDPDQKNYYEILLALKYEERLQHVYLMEIDNEFISLHTDRSWLNVPSFLFTDSLIHGKTVNIEIRADGGGGPKTVIFRNVSRSYYLYRKRLAAHQYLQNREREVDLSFFRSEPVDMFSNINGGLGIFLAYYQDIQDCRAK